MTEQERAAELADEIERKGLAFTGDEPCDLVGSKDESVIVSALRLLAASAAGIAALRPGSEIDLGEFGTVVLVPKETPAPKWLDRVAEEIAEYRGLTSGWDGENAEAPSAHSVDEAIEFIRSLERGDIEPALHADGTVIIHIGYTALRFTNEGMSFVTRAMLAAVKEPGR